MRKYTVIDLVKADEQEAYSMVFDDENCPICKELPNKPRRSNNGLLGIVSGEQLEFAVEVLTHEEAIVLMLTDNWIGEDE